MSDVRNMVAFDCSNSSIRTILGTYDGEKLHMKTVLQRPNGMTCRDGVYYWDIQEIYRNMIDGLAQAVKQAEKIHSIGVCTWGVDFALYTAENSKLSDPLAYRNPFGSEILDRLSQEEQKEFFWETGILCDKINSVYMLRAVQEHFPDLAAAADKLLMVPDILNYMLTGVMQHEPSELSTSQLMDVTSGRISKKITGKMGIDSHLFGKIGSHGTKIGKLLPSVSRKIGIHYEIPVICVPSHDTAAAVLAVPAEKKDFAFISSGTWALIGSEEMHPIINEKVRKAGLTNEMGAFGRITLLKNNMGMFIVQKLKEEMQENLSWEEFYRLSDQYEEDTLQSGGDIPLFDVNDAKFFNPRSMSDAIWNHFKEGEQIAKTRSKDLGIIIRSFLKSLALSYRKTIEEIEGIRGKQFDEIYVVGGGAKNHRLNRLTAEYTGKTVVAGSSESTSCGNLLAQIKYFEPGMTIEELRDIIRNSIELEIFQPEGGNRK